MERTETKALVLSLLMINIFMFNFYLLAPVRAPSAATSTVSVNNPLKGTSNFVFYTNTTGVGFKFNATLRIDSGTDVFAWQVRMNYNSTLLNATRAFVGKNTDPDYVLYGQPTFAPTPTMTNGSILTGDTSLDASVSFVTSKKLCILEFEVMASLPPGGEDKFSSVLDIASVDTYILDDSLSEIPIAKTNGLYELDSAPTPTQISLSATPAILSNGGEAKLSGAISTVPLNGSVIFNQTWVTLWHRFGTTEGFVPLTGTSTNGSSGYSYNWTNTGNVAGLHQFQASWSGNDTYAGAVSGIVNVTVIALPTQISISATPTTLNYGGTVRLSGVISTVPLNASEKFGFVRVNIFHRFGTSGDFTIMTSPYTNSTSGYSYIWQSAFFSAGLHQFQASWKGNATFAGANSSIVSVTVIVPAGSPTIYITNPQTGTNNFTFYTGTTPIGFKFNATVYVSNGTNVVDWQVAISYNFTYLNATEVTIPSTDAQYIFYGISTQSPTPAFLPGKVLMGSFTLPVQGVNFATPKILAIVEFQVMAAPPVGEGNKLTSILDISNPLETFIQDTNLADIPTFAANGLYELRSGFGPVNQITIGASPSTVTLGSIVTINGMITPTCPDARVTIWHKISTGSFMNLTTTTTSNASTYSYSWTSSGLGTHQFKANWTGNSQFFSAESAPISVTVVKASTTIDLTVKPTSDNLGEPFTLNGTVSFMQAGINVTIYHRLGTAGGFTQIAVVTTDSSGHYSYEWISDSAGTHQFMANWTGDEGHLGAQSAIQTVNVEKLPSTIYIIANPSVIQYGGNMTITGAVTPASDGLTVTIFYTLSSSYLFYTLTTVQTGPGGIYSYVWKPTQTGSFDIKARWDGNESYSEAESLVITVTITPVPPSITLNPTSGPIGTKVTVTGSNFNSTNTQYTSGYLEFDDQLVGIIAVNNDGTLNATFSIPASEMGLHVVQVKIQLYPTYQMITTRANFTVIDTTPLDIKADVGASYTAGEPAEFYVQSVLKGVSVDMTSIEATLYRPDGTTQALSARRIAIGFYKITYAIPTDAVNGTYALVIEGNYQSAFTDSEGTTVSTFNLSSATVPTKSDVAGTLTPLQYLLIIAAALAFIAIIGLIVLLLRRRRPHSTIENRF